MIGKELSVLVQLATILIKYSSCQDVFNINTKKVLAVTSDKFLSLTFDPAVLMTGNVLASSTEQSTNMAKGLAPGYVRLAGPRSNAFTFERTMFPQNGSEQPNFIFSEAHWVLVQEWAQRAGLEVVSCLTPQRIENEDQVAAWDPRNSLDLISFSDHMGYNISWQLGYECQTRCDISGFDLGKDVARLKNMLGAFPRYSNSLIAGPDVVNFRSKQQQQFIQDYLNAAGNALSVITWHPDFAGISLDADGVSLQTDTLAVDKDLLYKAIGRTVAKKPLWIAESKPEDCKRQFLGALVWARRLGSAAKLGVQVIMRQPDTSNILQPTPDYWVSLLHKMLVGREVLDAKFTSGNKTHVHFYCQCTKPSSKYDRGAVTIFGLNLTPNKITVSLKGLKIKAVHKYILMPGYDNENRMFAETVLLNNEPLNLVDEKTLPDINPAVTLIGKNMAVKLPSGGIGFWVVPGARVKSCMGHDEEAGDKILLKKLTKRLEESEAVDENVGHEIQEDQDLDVESEAEDIKSLFKSKMKKRKLRHSDEIEDEERRFKRLDAKREFEKLEKFLKRNSNNDDKKSSHFKGRMGLAMFDAAVNESAEDKKDEDSLEEDEGLMRFKKDKTDSVEDTNAKIEKYKKKVIEYETRKKNHEERFPNKHEPIEPTETALSGSNGQLDEHSVNGIDSQKAIEALALISRMEGAMRNYGVHGEKMKYEVTPRNVKQLDTQASDTGEELLIEELEKQDKHKRMIDPKSLNQLYQFFFSNGEQSQVDKRDVAGDSELKNVEKNRERRDLEKLLGDDPLGLRKEGLFKKRFKNDDVKERRLERRHRKKDKDEIGLKKDFGVTRFDPRLTDSNENNFFGFPNMKPIENFPQGDVLFTEGSSSQEKDADYDYVTDDDEVETKMQKRNKHRKSNSRKESRQVADETWIEEPTSNLYQAPNEFFEKLNLPPVSVKTQWKDYAELWEPESLQQKELRENNRRTQQKNDTVDEAVLPRDHPDDREDKGLRETTVKKLINYYDNSEMLGSEQTFDQEKPQLKEKKNRFKPEVSVQGKAKVSSKPNKPEKTPGKNTKRMLDLGNDYEDNADIGSMEFVNSRAEDSSEDMYNDDDEHGGVIGSELRTRGRPRRSPDNMDDMLNREMILEDAGNFKDCKCRVIRGTGKLRCKNCKKMSRYRRDIADADTGETADYSTATPEPTTVDQQAEAEGRPAKDLPVDINDNEKISEQGTDRIDIFPPSQQTSTGSKAAYRVEETLPAPNSETLAPSETRSLKNTELSDLNASTNDSVSSMVASPGSLPIPMDGSSTPGDEIKQFENNVPAFSPNSTGETESTSDSVVVLQEVYDLSDGRVDEVKDSNDDAVGSQELLENSDGGNGTTTQSPETLTLDQGNPIEPEEKLEGGKKAGDIDGNVSSERTEEIQAKRQTPELSEYSSESESGTRISLGTGVVGESSAKSDITDGQTKLREKLEIKLKSGLKNDFSKNKLVLNTEALSALIKENESKKAEVMKALESSAKLKSIDNAKYLEYQRKRTEKLASLKDKLKERKAKILQQYRQELLDALSKCDDEVEKNLKRREIWDDFTREDEFEDFVDKDKLAYLMMNRPVNYENTEGQTNGGTEAEDRRYYPEIAYVQPLSSPRERKIASKEPRRVFYEPRGLEYAYARELPSSQESFFDPSSAEDSYYAIVDSMENPKIFQKKHFDVYRNGGQTATATGERNVASDSHLDDGKAENVQPQEKSMSRRYSDDNYVTKESYGQEEDEQIYQKKNGDDGILYHLQNYPRHKLPYRRLQPVDDTERSYIYENGEPMVHAYYDEDFGQEYYDEYPREENALYGTYGREAWRPGNFIPGEDQRRIFHYRENPRPVAREGEQFLTHKKIADDQTPETKSQDDNVSPEQLTSPKRFALYDVNAKEDHGEFNGDKIALRDGFGISRRRESPCSNGRCGNQASGSPQKWEESQRYVEYPTEEFELPNSKIILPRRSTDKLLSRSERHLVPQDKQTVDKPAYKTVSLDPWHDPTVRKQREVKGKQANYICLKEDSQEDGTEDEKRLFKLVRNDDYYAAVPITDLMSIPEESNPERLKKNYRRVAKREGKVRNTRRKYSTYDFSNGGDADDYAQNSDRYVDKNLEKRQHSEKRKFVKQRNENSAKSHDETDYREIGEEVNRLEPDAGLSPEEYELLMLIPVKKHAAKRQRRELLNNEIDRSENYEDMMNKPWDDLLGVKWNEENLQKQGMEARENPVLRLQNFDRIISDLNAPDQETIAVVTEVKGQPDGIYFEEYSKENIFETVDSSDKEKEHPTTSAPGTQSPPTFYDIVIPKLESTINDELDKVGNLTESLEDFINKFDNGSNTTAEIPSNKTASEIPNDEPNTHYNLFHTVLMKVKKFIKFLSGISLVFSRY